MRKHSFSTKPKGTPKGTPGTEVTVQVPVTPAEFASKGWNITDLAISAMIVEVQRKLRSQLGGGPWKKAEAQATAQALINAGGGDVRTLDLPDGVTISREAADSMRAQGVIVPEEAIEPKPESDNDESDD